MYQIHVDVADILARVLSSAWMTVVLAAIAIIQTWRVATKNRHHQSELTRLQHQLEIESEKTKAAHGEHRVLADKVYRAAFNLQTAVKTLDYFFNQFHIHLGKAPLLEDDIQRVKHYLGDLQQYGSDARRLGERYLSLLSQASFSALQFTGDVDGLHVFAKMKGPTDKVYEMTEAEWRHYRTSSERAINATKQLVDEMTAILGEVAN